MKKGLYISVVIVALFSFIIVPIASAKGGEPIHFPVYDSAGAEVDRVEYFNLETAMFGLWRMLLICRQSVIAG